jgi:hypothetical protein
MIGPMESGTWSDLAAAPNSDPEHQMLHSGGRYRVIRACTVQSLKKNRTSPPKLHFKYTLSA